MGKKYYLAPPGYDPVVDPLPAEWTNRKSGGGGGASSWLTVLFWGALLLAILAFGFRSQIGQALALAQAPPTASPAPTIAPTATGESLSAPVVLAATSAHPTRTPVVWPTFGVMHLTPTPGPSQPASTRVAASPSASVTPVMASGFTPIPPTQTPRIIYTGSGGGGGVVTVEVSVTEPPLPTYTPFPTYTPLPTYTEVPPSPTATYTPEPTATCPPVIQAEPSAPGPYVVYLALVFGGGGPAASCVP